MFSKRLSSLVAADSWKIDIIWKYSINLKYWSMLFLTYYNWLVDVKWHARFTFKELFICRTIAVLENTFFLNIVRDTGSTYSFKFFKTTVHIYNWKYVRSFVRSSVCKENFFGSSEFPSHNLRQIGPGVYELWSNIQTNRQANREYILKLQLWKSVEKK